MLGVVEHAGGLAGKGAVGEPADPEPPEHVGNRLRLHRQRDARGPDVARLREHRREIDAAELRLVLGDDAIVDRERAGRRVDDAARVVGAALQRRGHHERLEARAGLEDVGDRAVAIIFGPILRPVVRVVRRLIDHREHFAGSRVEHDDRARQGAAVGNRRLELAVGEILDSQIDARAQVAPRSRRLQQLDVADDLAAPILEHSLAAALAFQPMVERGL